MPSKVQLDKAAWQWVENIVDPSDVSLEHLQTAYRCNLKPCVKGECRRNCKGNPSCLNALGERTWFKELDESCWRNFDPESEKREEGKFVGLKNLGATCYVNTFLQLWFHNAEVRHAVYQWQDVGQIGQEGTEWKPSSVCGHLQLLFGLMQFSKRAYIDPSPLIECLGLDTREQQDAQEFSKLFLSLLEGSLMQRSPSQCSNIVQQQFAGTYCYITRCQTCGSESSCESTFYELDISIHGHSSLVSSLRDFLQEEKLEGENQYMCGVCNSKQNAVRFIKLHTMPPVLNLQLLRFVFDVKRGHKKKLNSYLQFGDVLDMSEFLQQSAKTTVYDLTAVLIHRGPSAYSGHYVAHIQDTASKLWYRFNDEEIAVMKGRKLHLGKEEDIMPADLLEIDETSGTKSHRCPKGMHSSRDAYMLVYTRRKMAEDGEESEPPPAAESLADLPTPVRAYIEKDNARFEDWIQDIALTQDANMFSRKEKQMLVQSIYSSLFCTPSDTQFEWLPADWISNWLADPDKVQPISTAGYLCPHGRLRPGDVCKMKIVSTAGADQLYSEYGGDTRLKGQTALCMECVQQCCQEIKLKEKLAEHSRLLNTALKLPADGEQCYWVGKTSLRSWKSYALQQIGPDYNADSTTENSLENEEEVESNGTSGDAAVKAIGQNGDGDCHEETASDRAVLEDTFNSDLLCDLHGALKPDEGCRRLVCEAAWKQLRLLFPQCPEFHKDDPVCPDCQNMLRKEQEVKAECRQRVVHQREQLQDLYLGRNRPTLTQVYGCPVFALTSTFLQAWKKFVKNKEGGQLEPIQEIVNKPLLCEHGKLAHPVTLAEDFKSDQMVLVWAAEWESLTQHYSFDVAIEIFTVQEEGGHLSLCTVPELCDECVAQRLLEEEESQFKFEQAIIYVRKVVPTPLTPVLDSESPQEENEVFRQTREKAKCDQEVLAKKPRLDEGAVRKSKRHRKLCGEKEIKVSSDLTLRDFKIKVMNQFSIPTFDQNLSVDGRAVTDNSATLGQLHFYPGCVVTLRADEPVQDTVIGMDNPTARKREEGFKGTSLVSS